MKQYEYMISQYEYIAELNMLGREGWELVAIKHSNSECEGDRFYFKREIPEPNGRKCPECGNMNLTKDGNCVFC